MTHPHGFAVPHAAGLVILLSLVGLAMLARPARAGKPETLSIGERMVVLRLPDGTLMGALPPTGGEPQQATARYSHDNGSTWTAPEVLLDLPQGGGSFGGLEALLDSRGEVHLFLLRWGKAGDALPEGAEALPHGYMGGYSGKRLDLWHTRSSDGRRKWSAPKPIWFGYTGALNSVIQMANGRIILPFSDAQEPRAFGGGGDDLLAFTHMGSFGCTVLCSDDFGQTWQASPDTLRTAVPSFVHGYGADEPVVVELNDGRVWMLMRTQLGRFWQSHSEDGIHWLPPEPTDIINSDSPAGLVRLEDGRLVLFWNNCQRFPYAYGGRHVLHAAVSDDGGRTWRGYREVARDPRRTAPPPSRGDFGTAYPFPAVVNAGKVIYCTGQGEGRVLLMRLDPEWLLETHHESSFSPEEEDEWQTFGTRGVEYVPAAGESGGRMLSIRKPEREWPAAAVWNFPAGRRGRLRLGIMLRKGGQGARLSLADHFSVPFDLEAHMHSVFNVEIGPDGELSGGRSLPVGEWCNLTLDWSVNENRCRVHADGRRLATVPLIRRTTGVCYLRIMSAARETDPEGLAFRSVVVDVEPIRR